MSYREHELVYYVQFMRREDSGAAFTEVFDTDIERDQAISDAREDGYIVVRQWEILVDAM